MSLQYPLKKTNRLELFNFTLFGVLLLLYAPILLHWLDGWLKKSISIEHEYFSHGIIGIPFAAYLVWSHRKQWGRLPNIAHPLGGALLVVGSCFYLTGVPEWVNLSFPVILTGICFWFKGFAGFKLQSFPLLLVFLATPTAIPYLITPFTLPLQSFIAGTAAFVLHQFGMEVVVDGINIYVGGRIVEVAPYCAGLKMLFTTLYISLILLYWVGILSDKRKTIWFLSSAILISVTANVIRNTLLTYFHGTAQDQTFKWLHDGWGGDFYSAVMLLSLIPVLNWIDRRFSVN